uniref:Uncharacterized protein n=1 Tax=Anguilla anguilla TaxID=7936 RepID=A0A0E9Q3L0_ANGAN
MKRDRVVTRSSEQSDAEDRGCVDVVWTSFRTAVSISVVNPAVLFCGLSSFLL